MAVTGCTSTRAPRDAPQSWCATCQRWPATTERDACPISRVDAVAEQAMNDLYAQEDAAMAPPPTPRIKPHYLLTEAELTTIMACVYLAGMQRRFPLGLGTDAERVVLGTFLAANRIGESDDAQREHLTTTLATGRERHAQAVQAIQAPRTFTDLFTALFGAPSSPTQGGTP